MLKQKEQNQKKKKKRNRIKAHTEMCLVESKKSLAKQMVCLCVFQHSFCAFTHTHTSTLDYPNRFKDKSIFNFPISELVDPLIGRGTCNGNSKINFFNVYIPLKYVDSHLENCQNSTACAQFSKLYHKKTKNRFFFRLKF